MSEPGERAIPPLGVEIIVAGSFDHRFHPGISLLRRLPEAQNVAVRRLA